MGPERAHTIEREIDAATLNRGVRHALPIVHTAAKRSVVEGIASAEVRLHEAEKALGRPLGLIVLDGVTFGSDGAWSAAATVLMQVRGAFPHAAVIIVADAALAELMIDESVVIEVGTSAFGCGRSAIGTWGSEIEILSVRFPDGCNARVIRPGDAIEVEPAYIDANLETIPAPPRKIVVPELEPSTRWVVMPVTRRLSAEETAPWDAYDRIVTDETAAVPSAEQAKVEGLRLIEIVASDQDGRQQEAQRRAQNVLHLARTRGVEHAVKVVISVRTIRRWAAQA